MTDEIRKALADFEDATYTQGRSFESGREAGVTFEDARVERLKARASLEAAIDAEVAGYVSCNRARRAAEDHVKALEGALEKLSACVRNRIDGWRMEADAMHLSEPEVRTLRSCALGLEIHATPLLAALAAGKETDHG